jgi:hypothetical protein
VSLILTPAQSVVVRDIKPDDAMAIETILQEHGIKSLEMTDRLSRKSMACPAFPLCGLAVTEAERAQPEINSRLCALMDKMGLEDLTMVTRTTGCPNGCARPYMAEMALVGSGKNMYQVWLGGHPDQVERTGWPMPNLFRMKLKDLEVTFEPIFAMYKQQRLHEDEAFGDFCNRRGAEAIEAYMKDYEIGSYETWESDSELSELEEDSPEKEEDRAARNSLLPDILRPEAGEEAWDARTRARRVGTFRPNESEEVWDGKMTTKEAALKAAKAAEAVPEATEEAAPEATEEEVARIKAAEEGAARKADDEEAAQIKTAEENAVSEAAEAAAQFGVPPKGFEWSTTTF